jgi:protein involved in polysaccharide export with SLBB domain
VQNDLLIPNPSPFSKARLWRLLPPSRLWLCPLPGGAPRSPRISLRLLRLIVAWALALAPRAHADSEPPPFLPSNYRIAPGDVLLVKVFQEPDLDSQHRVAKDGSIAMPLIGPVTVGGKTVAECAALVRDQLAKGYLRNPQVRVNVVQYAMRRFSILGQVQRPGAYSMAEETTTNLLEAIAMAGGYTKSADPADITIRRKTEGADKILKVSAKNLEKNRGEEVFLLLPGDLIIVGERLF